MPSTLLLRYTINVVCVVTWSTLHLQQLQAQQQAVAAQQQAAAAQQQATAQQPAQSAQVGYGGYIAPAAYRPTYPPYYPSQQPATSTPGATPHSTQQATASSSTTTASSSTTHASTPGAYGSYTAASTSTTTTPSVAYPTPYYMQQQQYQPQTYGAYPQAQTYAKQPQQQTAGAVGGQSSSYTPQQQQVLQQYLNQGRNIKNFIKKKTYQPSDQFYCGVCKVSCVSNLVSSHTLSLSFHSFCISSVDSQGSSRGQSSQEKDAAVYSAASLWSRHLPVWRV